MAKEKQYVFSARTTEEGLKALKEVKSCFNIGWDELVIDAVSAHYNLDKAMMTLPKKGVPSRETPANEPPTNEPATEQTTAIGQKQPIERNRPENKQKKGGKK